MTHTNYTFNVGITVLSGDTTKLRTPHNSADVVHLNGPTNPHILERRVLLPCPSCAFVVAPDWSQERIASCREISKMLPERAVWPASSRCSDDHSADTRVGLFCRTLLSMISRTSWKRRLWPVMRISPVWEKGFRCHVRTTQNFEWQYHGQSG